MKRIQTSRCYHWKTQVPNKGIHHACPVSFRETLPPLLATPSSLEVACKQPFQKSSSSSSVGIHTSTPQVRYMYVSASQLTLRYLDYLTYIHNVLTSLFVMMMVMMMSGAALSDTAFYHVVHRKHHSRHRNTDIIAAAHAYLCIGQRLDRPTDRAHCYHIQTLTCLSETHAKRRL